MSTPQQAARDSLETVSHATLAAQLVTVAFTRWAKGRPLSPGMHRAIRDAGLGIIDHEHCLILNDAGRARLASARQQSNNA